MVVSSVQITGLGDIGFADNQCDVRLSSGFVLMNLLLFAWSPRVCDNRFQEVLKQVAISGFVMGFMNMTTNNVATHCLVAKGSPGLTRKIPNIVLIDEIDDAYCERFEVLLGIGD